jgi:hypothetical protein
MKPNQVPEPQREADQTVRLPIDTKDRTSSIRISFTDQRLTAHGGMLVWSHFLHQKGFRRQLREVLLSPSGTKPARGERFKTGHSEVRDSYHFWFFNQGIFAAS